MRDSSSKSQIISRYEALRQDRQRLASEIEKVRRLLARIEQDLPEPYRNTDTASDSAGEPKRITK